MNRLKTMMLLATLTALVLWAGQALGGQGGLALAVIFALVMNFGAYWFSDKIVLRMYGAVEVTAEQAPRLFQAVRNLALRAGLPMPKLYLIPELAPNAFATGRNPENAAVAVTEGLLEALNGEELEAVVAHELGHIKNRDTLIMTVAATMAGAISSLANMAMFGSLFGGRGEHDDEDSSPMGGLLGIVLAPIAAALIQAAISRSREFLADEAAARISGNPLALAGALRKIETWSRQVPMEHATPATAHLFISNPFAGGGMLRLFSTHPPTGERIARLERMALSGVALVA